MLVNGNPSDGASAMQYGFETPPSGWVAVESSNVEAIRWDPSHELHVRFKNGKGSYYRYLGAGPNVFFDMLRSSSKGRYVAYILRPRYTAVKVG